VYLHAAASEMLSHQGMGNFTPSKKISEILKFHSIFFFQVKFSEK